MKTGSDYSRRNSSSRNDGTTKGNTWIYYDEFWLRCAGFLHKRKEIQKSVLSTLNSLQIHIDHFLERALLWFIEIEQFVAMLTHKYINAIRLQFPINERVG